MPRAGKKLGGGWDRKKGRKAGRILTKNVNQIPKFHLHQSPNWEDVGWVGCALGLRRQALSPSDRSLGSCRDRGMSSSFGSRYSQTSLRSQPSSFLSPHCLGRLFFVRLSSLAMCPDQKLVFFCVSFFFSSFSPPPVVNLSHSCCSDLFSLKLQWSLWPLKIQV